MRLLGRLIQDSHNISSKCIELCPRNHRVLNEPARHVTRFIGLGKVGNADKRKWLYAFNIAPLKGMERAALVAQGGNSMKYVPAD